MAGNEPLLKESQPSEEKSERSSLWRKEGSEKTKKTRYIYKSVDDVIEESKKQGKKKIGIRYANSFIMYLLFFRSFISIFIFYDFTAN